MDTYTDTDRYCNQCKEWTDHTARDHKRICETCGHNYIRSAYHGMEFVMRGECDECPDCEDRRDAE